MSRTDWHCLKEYHLFTPGIELAASKIAFRTVFGDASKLRLRFTTVIERRIGGSRPQTDS
jgi:hypothetical protein